LRLTREFNGELLNPHLEIPFFDALPDTEKTPPAPNEVIAGLVVLRLLDDRMDRRQMATLRRRARARADVLTDTFSCPPRRSQ
jgi:hypothetical protein